MISKKVHNSGLIDLENEETPIHDLLAIFNEIGAEQISSCSDDIDEFDKYIIDYFFEGISSK